MEETDALGAIVGLGVAVLATSHFHVDKNKPNIDRIQQTLVKSILSHRTLNGLAGGLVYTTLGDRVAQERGVKKNFASSKFATLPFKWCLYMRDTNPMSWPDMFDMHYEAKIAIDELNTAAGTPAREMQFNASPNVGSGGNRRRKRSRDDFSGDLETQTMTRQGETALFNGIACLGIVEVTQESFKTFRSPSQVLVRAFCESQH